MLKEINAVIKRHAFKTINLYYEMFENEIENVWVKYQK